MRTAFGSDPIPGVDSQGAPHLTPENAQLCVLNGPKAGRSFPLRELRLVVGRNDPPIITVDIDLTECELGTPAMVSRRHVELQWREGRLHIIDLGSTNGTFVDDEPVSVGSGQPSPARILLSGSRVRLANLETEIHSRGER